MLETEPAINVSLSVTCCRSVFSFLGQAYDEFGYAQRLKRYSLSQDLFPVNRVPRFQLSKPGLTVADQSHHTASKLDLERQPNLLPGTLCFPLNRHT